MAALAAIQALRPGIFNANACAGNVLKLGAAASSILLILDLLLPFDLS